MVKLSRWLKHTFMPPWCWRLSFPADVLNDIEKAVKQSESQHSGELRFAIENSLAPGWVWHGMAARHRAAQVFSNLRVWDTEENSGVLIYVQLADREVHILADRGINKRVQLNGIELPNLSKQNFIKSGFGKAHCKVLRK
jgi:TPM domain